MHVQGPRGTKLYARHAETLANIPSEDQPMVPVRNQYCNNQATQPGSASDHGCTSCNMFGGSGANASFAAIWGGNCANQTNLFVLNGSSSMEHWRPEFSYAGFRYVQVWGFVEAGIVPTSETLLQTLFTDVTQVGSVHIPVVASPHGTTDILNRIQHATISLSARIYTPYRRTVHVS